MGPLFHIHLDLILSSWCPRANALLRKRNQTFCVHCWHLLTKKSPKLSGSASCALLLKTCHREILQSLNPWIISFFQKVGGLKSPNRPNPSGVQGYRARSEVTEGHCPCGVGKSEPFDSKRNSSSVVLLVVKSLVKKHISWGKVFQGFRACFDDLLSRLENSFHEIPRCLQYLWPASVKSKA